jgi:protocatechuate 3,4-dioxygenase beta subunit
MPAPHGVHACPLLPVIALFWVGRAEAQEARTAQAAQEAHAAQAGQQDQATQPLTLRGRVVTFDGAPVAEAAVAYAAAAELTTRDLLEQPTARTDAAGRFELAVPAPPAIERLPKLLHVAKPGMAAVGRSVGWKRSKTVAPDQADADDAAEPKAAAWEPVTDLGDIVLTAGLTLAGRVRDQDGKPLAGVRVTARDAFEGGRWFRGQPSWFLSTTETDPNGIFRLPCALPQAVGLELRRPGFHTVSLPCVAADTPLEVELQAAGFLAGRVLDADGRGVADARVTLHSERRGGREVTWTAADGSFRLTRAQPGRVQVVASRRSDQGSSEARSEILTAPHENLELHFAASGADGEPMADTFAVRAVAKATGEPVPSFRAAAVFEQYANQNPNYLEYRLSMHLPPGVRAKDGEARLPRPSKNAPTVGAVRVLARGFAPGTVRDWEWTEPEAGSARPPLVVELVAESTLQGFVRDERSGKGLAGARVFARCRPDAGQSVFDQKTDPPGDAAVTNDQGAFALRGLGEGTWQVCVQHPDHPPVPPEEVELHKEQHRTDLVLKLPPGGTVRGRLVNLPPTPGAKVFLQELAVPSFTDGNLYSSVSYGGVQKAGPDQVDIGADGAFEFRGLKLQNFMLVLAVPSPPRGGGSLYMPIEPFRLRAEGLTRDFDVRADAPGVIQGKVAFSAEAVPNDRLCVVARNVGDDNRLVVSPFDTSYPGPRSFVDRGGNFSLRVGPGNHRLQLVDVATGLCLATSEKPCRIQAAGQATVDLAAALQRVRVRLEPADRVAGMADVDRLEVRLVPKGAKQTAGANEHYDTGTGIAIPPGASSLELALPLGEVLFLLRSDVAQLRTDDQRFNSPPSGRGEFVVEAADAPIECVLEVGPPPEIPAAKPAAGGQQTDAEAVQRKDD